MASRSNKYSIFFISIIRGVIIHETPIFASNRRIGIRADFANFSMSYLTPFFWKSYKNSARNISIRHHKRTLREWVDVLFQCIFNHLLHLYRIFRGAANCILYPRIVDWKLKTTSKMYVCRLIFNKSARNISSAFQERFRSKTSYISQHFDFYKKMDRNYWDVYGKNRRASFALLAKSPT